MKKINVVVAIIACCTVSANAQIDAALFRTPDVSATSIVFTYANDLWIVPKEGGTANRISTPAGSESFARFSPDGKSIAFSGNYDGNTDVYVMPVGGGVPVRLTSHSYGDRVVDWTNDGKSVLFASSRASGKMRFNQFYTIPATGGAAEKLPLEYAEYGSYSPDGKHIAVVYITQTGRTWKRYKGGTKGSMQVFDFDSGQSTAISPTDGGGDEFPMWHGDYIYFISDSGPEMRMNLWRYNTTNGQRSQLTHYKDYDIHTPALGAGEIVYVQGGKLHLYNIASGNDKVVSVNVIYDQATLKPKITSVANLVQHLHISPDGSRVVVEARGDLFSLPAKDGYVKNLTNTSGVAERYPAWSPDGKSIAYWSDESGEYELWIKDMTKGGKTLKITNYGPGFRYNLTWSPDSKKLCFIDQAGAIYMVQRDNGSTEEVDKMLLFASHGVCEYFSVSWSPDSRYIAYEKGIPNNHSAIFIYDALDKKTRQVTSGFYSCGNPVFESTGKYLYFNTNQHFDPVYSDFDNTFVYNNSTSLAVMTLQKDSVAFLAIKNDTVKITETPVPASNTKDKKDKKKDQKASVEEGKGDKTKATVIDFEDMEQRMEILSPVPGNIYRLGAAEGKILFLRYPNTGAPDDQKSALKYYDIESREEKSMMDGVNGYWLSADGKKLLVAMDGKYAVVSPGENVKFENPLRLAEMTATVDPRSEWRQLITDTWRMQRDYFYDKDMHGVDWPAVKDKYLDLLDNIVTREDLGQTIGELIGELNASHTYYGGGDLESGKSVGTGYLGIDWEPDGKYYKVKKIIRGAPWDAEVRSSLDHPGVAIKEGDYILAVNGIAITTDNEPYVAFAGLNGKTVLLTYNTRSAIEGAKEQLVTTLNDEYRLRNLAWIEGMRAQVDKATNGEVGYIYVPSTGMDGQLELMRMFNAQLHKKALIIDERFNNGGQIPDRFIEMLDRKPLVYWATRDGEAWKWPPAGHFGPKVMLINGWSGSGGDAFPDYFRKRELGPLIGSRTWGGLIGISGAPSLIDGGTITVPTFRMYNLDGTWFAEGHGVDPDIVVPENLGAFSKGIDVQLDRAIQEAKKLLTEKPFIAPQRPPKEKR